MHRQTALQWTTYRVSILLVLVVVIAACVIACRGGDEPTNQASVQPRAESGRGHVVTTRRNLAHVKDSLSISTPRLGGEG